MTLDEIITSARSIAGDLDSAAYRYTDTEIIAVLVEVRRSLAVRSVATLSGVAIDAQAATITPEPSDTQGMILATAAALKLLQQTYRERMDNGTIGVSWTSGLEQESTISQEKAYGAMLKDLENELQVLILMSIKTTSATRPQ